MSYCAIVTFVGGNPQGDGPEFRNAWGGAARIWTALFDRYLKHPSRPYDTWLTRCDDLWALAGDTRLTTEERSALFATFDNRIVRNENFARLAGDLRSFSQHHPSEGVDHLPAWAEFLDSCDAEAVGFHHTSVIDNPWFRWDGDSEEYEPIKLTGEYPDIYEEMESDDS